MIAKWAELRLVGTLRRIAKALEEANRLERFRQEREYPPARVVGNPDRRKLVVSHPSVDDWNRSKGPTDAA